MGRMQGSNSHIELNDTPFLEGRSSKCDLNGVLSVCTIINGEEIFVPIAYSANITQKSDTDKVD